ncbi:putative metallopeptidase [Sinorhizobium meliloti]|uniref:putative metallopeptidase n=1 Tax=Rhizobium meliloti TaxID=382 RepID=UPI0022783163
MNGPVFTVRGHDVEEFVGVVRRYGADAAGVRAIVDAANRPPEIAGHRSPMLAVPASLRLREGHSPLRTR